MSAIQNIEGSTQDFFGDVDIVRPKTDAMIATAAPGMATLDVAQERATCGKLFVIDDGKTSHGKGRRKKRSNAMSH